MKKFFRGGVAYVESKNGVHHRVQRKKLHINSYGPNFFRRSSILRTGYLKVFDILKIKQNTGEHKAEALKIDKKFYGPNYKGPIVNPFGLEKISEILVDTENGRPSIIGLVNKIEGQIVEVTIHGFTTESDATREEKIFYEGQYINSTRNRGFNIYDICEFYVLPWEEKNPKFVPKKITGTSKNSQKYKMYSHISANVEKEFLRVFILKEVVPEEVLNDVDLSCFDALKKRRNELLAADSKSIGSFTTARIMNNMRIEGKMSGFDDEKQEIIKETVANHIDSHQKTKDSPAGGRYSEKSSTSSLKNSTKKEKPTKTTALVVQISENGKRTLLDEHGEFFTINLKTFKSGCYARIGDVVEFRAKTCSSIEQKRETKRETEQRDVNEDKENVPPTVQSPETLGPKSSYPGYKTVPNGNNSDQSYFRHGDNQSVSTHETTSKIQGITLFKKYLKTDPVTKKIRKISSNNFHITFYDDENQYACSNFKDLVKNETNGKLEKFDKDDDITCWLTDFTYNNDGQKAKAMFYFDMSHLEPKLEVDEDVKTEPKIEELKNVEEDNVEQTNGISELVLRF